MAAAKKKPAATKKPTTKKSAAKKLTTREPRAATPVKVATAVRRLIADLDRKDPEGVALGAIAFNLATMLDEGAGMSSAAVARELRETLDRIGALDAGDEDAFEAWEKQLASPM